MVFDVCLPLGHCEGFGSPHVVGKHGVAEISIWLQFLLTFLAFGALGPRFVADAGRPAICGFGRFEFESTFVVLGSGFSLGFYFAEP